MNSISVFLLCFIFSLKSYVVYCETTPVMYVGCYQHVNQDEWSRVRGDFPRLTTELCRSYCLERQFPYTGTMNGSQCYCSQTKPPEDKKTEESKCNVKCLGDITKSCGGRHKLSVFSTGALEISGTDEVQESLRPYIVRIPVLRTPISPRLTPFSFDINGGTNLFKPFKCYGNALNRRVLPFLMDDIEGFLTNVKCVNRCLQRGYLYGGTEDGRFCYCGNTEPSADREVGPERCNTPCRGLHSLFETCGGSWHVAVYSFNNIPQTIVTPVADTTHKPCATSETVVTGDDDVCKDEVIFEDQFNTPLAFNNKWKHVVKIPNDSELEFSVFNSDPKNSYISENGLVIKPTVFNDTFVQTGLLHLKRCTGNLLQGECLRVATPNNILPPVESARLQTHEYFSFRYGIVEIRAKLPIGDWLVPELWLEPKSKRYGPAYESGRIRVAMNRGNVDLKCNSEDLGSNLLESGVVMGSADNVRRRSLMTNLPENWHSSFHNYTLKWTPDKISFQVDNEQPQELLPETGKSLCEVVGFENSECLTWNSGSKIAPFDQDFYISLGLTVGNARDFPDDCINRGKQKPWKNSDQKAMYKFWQDKNNWSQTWTDEDSSLYIQHIRVTAL